MLKFVNRTMIATAVIFTGSIGAVQAEFPEKEIKMIVNAGAGGSTGAGARILAKAMESILGKPMIVINKPGGAGSKGGLLVKKAAADGYTIGYTFSHNIGFAGQFKRDKALYTDKTFDFIGSITDPRQSLVTLAGKGWKNLGEMVKKFKAEGKPIRMVYSGGPGRLIGTAIQRDLGVETKIIRVKGGGNSMQRVLGGHVDIVFTGGAHAKYTAAGQTIVVAAIDESRDPQFPKVPTFKEMGGNASATTLQIVYAPKNLPAAIRAKLADAVSKASKDPSVKKLYEKNLRMRVMNIRGKALDNYMAKEQTLYSSLIKQYGGKK